MKNAFLYLLEIMALFLLVVLTFETSLRFSQFNRVLSDSASGYVLPEGYLTSHPDYGFDISPSYAPREAKTTPENLNYKIWSNSSGCYDEEADTQADIIALGDSATHAILPLEKKWSTQLQILLKKDVHNCGVLAFGLTQARMKFENILKKKKVSHILITTNVTDPLDDFLFPRKTIVDGHLVRHRVLRENGVIVALDQDTIRRKLHHWQNLCVSRTDALDTWERRASCWLKRHSITFNLVVPQLFKFGTFASWREIFANEEGQVWTLSPYHGVHFERFASSYLEQVNQFKSLAKKHHMMLTFIIIPAREIYFDPARKKENEKLHQGLVEMLEKSKVHFLDFKKYIDTSPNPKDYYLAHDLHMSAWGEKNLALFISEALQVLPHSQKEPGQKVSRK